MSRLKLVAAVIGATTICACSDPATAPKTANPLRPSASYSPGAGGLTVTLSIDDPAGGGVIGVEGYHTITPTISGGSGGPYEYHWYEKLCTILYRPTRNYCDPGYHATGGINSSTISLPFFRPTWELDVILEVQEQGSGPSGMASADYAGPGDPYEGSPASINGCDPLGMGFDLSGFYYNSDATIYRDPDGFPVTYQYRLNSCNGGTVMDPNNQPAPPTY